MKTLYLVRHAKSDHPEGIADYDRPLNERGHQDARQMARHLHDSGYRIDAFVSSPAKRALTTCRYFAETYGDRTIQKKEHLYEPLIEDFEKTIKSLDNECTSAALFSHNPTVSEFAGILSKDFVDFPTCGVAVFELETDSWENYQNCTITLKEFLQPKDLR